jgi:hypothetical protein
MKAISGASGPTAASGLYLCRMRTCSSFSAIMDSTHHNAASASAASVIPYRPPASAVSSETICTPGRSRARAFIASWEGRWTAPPLSTRRLRRPTYLRSTRRALMLRYVKLWCRISIIASMYMQLRATFAVVACGRLHQLIIPVLCGATDIAPILCNRDGCAERTRL